MTKAQLFSIFLAIAVLGIAMYTTQGYLWPASPVVASQVVELADGATYELTASAVEKEIGGRTYRMLAYNGSIPGPLIKVAQGSEVTINFTNDTGMKTLLHSHGVRMDNAFDGSQTSQKEMEPGETFSYTLTFPDAGMYWYHPHVREDYQQELGLYGNFLVVSVDANYWSPVNREIPLFLDDLLIEGGNIELSTRGADRTLMGRFGNVMLINGDDNYTLLAKKGEVIRFYVTNSANVRPFNFAIDGARLKLVGADNGAYEHDAWKDSVLIGPSERAIVEVLFDKSGSFSPQNRTPNRTYTLGRIDVSAETIGVSYANEFAELRTHEATVRSIDALRPLFAKVPDKRISLSIDMMGGMMGGGGQHRMSDGSMMDNGMTMGIPEGGIEWEDDMQMMNAMSDADSAKWKIVDEDTRKENMDIDWSFKHGEPVKIRIFNDPRSMHPMQHPIHFHGQRFLVVARDGVPQTNLVWKDTVLVKAGETVDIVLDTSNPGKWMAHCHIAEHLEAGMMFTFKVE
ncbi:MAG: Multicopper oxidase [Parcubacteria group bacterium Gr01-1014_8]|nr:MAG: Multicopper oxidase [Parcubacteria group bacterium Gr01-1014_8]